MYRVIRLNVLFLAVFSGLFGCVSTSITAEKFVAISAPIEQLAIYVVEAKFVQPIEGLDLNSAGVNGNVDVQKFFPHLARRLPLIFSFNGIESKSVLSAPAKKFSTNYEYVLSLIPQRASWNSRGDTGLDVYSQITNARTHVKIWGGKISLETVGTGKYDEKVADVFAIKLLTRLRDDGIIKLRGADVQMPPSANAQL